jgi:hypothetical protein
MTTCQSSDRRNEAQPVKRERQADWDRLRILALSLCLPGVEETTSWGQPTLKAHGKLWVWWSPHEDAPVFKVPFEEREILVEAEPEAFFSRRTTGIILWSSSGLKSSTLTGQRPI